MNDEQMGKPGGRRPQIFRLNDTVRILSGPFVSFIGTIEGINQEKALLKVKVAIYGGTNPIKVSFSDVEKLPIS